ncbi:MAG TPA: glycosyltransferase family 2 protein [Candidatus Ozemobacteraceae bacterium]|nr:glycosyltransferase family 2 protein [Candidatus Ozemobacteraceae bacterium]
MSRQTSEQTATRVSPRVGIVMLTWNQKQMTFEGLTALRKLEGPKPRIVLVDNGSVDGTCEAVREAFPEVEVLGLPANEGFCAANNRGAELLLKDPGIAYVLFVNNDIDLEPDCVNRLTAFMDATPAAGACGPLIFYDNPRETVWAAGGRIYPDLMWFPPILRDRPWRCGNTPRRVGYIHGCALMVRRPVIETTGMFDERFFIYHDEVDWCHRMQLAGHEVWLVPAARLYHKVSQVVGQHSPMMIYYTSRNKLLFWWKHGRLSDLPKFYAFHLWKMIRIFARAGSPWAWISLFKALFDALTGGFGRGHIEAARNNKR